MTGEQLKVPPKSNGQGKPATLDRKQKSWWSPASARFETGERPVLVVCGCIGECQPG